MSELLPEYLNPAAIAKLKTVERKDLFKMALGIDTKNTSHDSKLFGLRQFFKDEWCSALLEFEVDNPSSIRHCKFLARHFSRERNFVKANEYLKQLIATLPSASNDAAREILRNQLCDNLGGLRFIDDELWSKVERIFQNKLAKNSYSYQSYVNQCIVQDGDFDLTSKPVTDFLVSLHNAREHLNGFSGEAFPDDLKKLLEYIGGCKTIAVVGKGESIKNKNLGEIIDSFDCVIRVNHMPDHSNLKDLGARTSFVVYAQHIANKFQGVWNNNVDCGGVAMDPFRDYAKLKSSAKVPSSGILEFYIESIVYRRATTGLRFLVFLSLLCGFDLDIHAFGFDFYSFPRLHQDGRTQSLRDMAGMAHEIDYEKWYAWNALPLISKLSHYSS